MSGLIVITGASSGIGESIAKEFSKQGHPLLLLARRLEKLHQLNLPKTICAAVDVTDYAALGIQMIESVFCFEFLNFLLLFTGMCDFS